ncbi:peptidylprolyl isomerase [Aestuariibacter halophilus]|uniref:Peptidyl-prolyl cis-trans isomerase n=1 Tax=Fluctibacter halophilus TaxID=226011 RepID=A0ABS8G6N3_9ALTE|nr:peptidylprolyl isomerase [Aestuariibacter halophilus]MCC2616195.1 peptidylprolyl isomerase [Aestuariibacter halophilus]
MVTLITNYGDITLKLFADKAPKTVENFLQYARDGFYDNTIFHRVIDGFMVQGGGFAPGMEQKPTRDPIANEANNGVSNATGTIAMARTNDPHSATAQFFINVNDNTFLDFRSESMDGWGYCAFGEVTDGMDVVNKIKDVRTGSAGFHQDVPVEDVIIERVEISE